MIPKPLPAIQLLDLQALIDNQVREGKTIEYRRQVFQVPPTAIRCRSWRPSRRSPTRRACIC